MKKLLVSLFALCAASAQALPQGMSFIGLSNNQWKAFIVTADGNVKAIDKIINPRQISWSPETKRLAYLEASGSVMEYHLITGKTVELASHRTKDAFTQLSFSTTDASLWAVRLKDRQSEKTSLDIFDREKNKFIPAHRQRGANFDPHAVKHQLLYTRVSCVIACGQIIQEVWAKNLITGLATQLTLLNALSRHPVWDAKKQRIIFSSNKSGSYQLWHITNHHPATAEKLTANTATNIEPAVDKTGTLYWIKRINGRGYLMKLNKGKELTVKLPGVTDIRDLEIAL